jgi:hypothetical protein
MLDIRYQKPCRSEAQQEESKGVKLKKYFLKIKILNILQRKRLEKISLQEPNLPLPPPLM